MENNSIDNWLVTSRPTTGSYSELRLGGITLYSSSAQFLNAQLVSINAAITAASREHILLIRQVLLSQTRTRLGIELPDRVFGAVLGRMLKLGEMKVFVTLSLNNKIMRVHYHQGNAERLHNAIGNIRVRLLKEGG